MIYKNKCLNSNCVEYRNMVHEWRIFGVGAIDLDTVAQNWSPFCRYRSNIVTLRKLLHSACKLHRELRMVWIVQVSPGG